MSNGPASLQIWEWPEADQKAWAEACRPGFRLTSGGRGSRLCQESQKYRYGAFLGFLKRSCGLATDQEAGALVNPTNVTQYIADLRSRITSVSTYNAVSKLRRAGMLLAPHVNFEWLHEIEKDLRLVMVPIAKLDRLVMTDRIVEAGLTLIVEARKFENNALARAQSVRNGLMIALLALCPIRLKNFAALGIGRTFRLLQGTWWIVLPGRDTKTSRRDERPVPLFLKPYIDIYVDECRPLLAARGNGQSSALWLSSVCGSPMTKKPVGTLISKITLEALGVDVSPHLFRTAAATTAAAYSPSLPHLASALLGHTDPSITEESYNKAHSMNAAQIFAAMVRTYQRTADT